MFKVNINNREYELEAEVLLSTGPKILTLEEVKGIHDDSIDYIHNAFPFKFDSIKRMMVTCNNITIGVDILITSTLIFKGKYAKPDINFKLSVDTDVRANKWFDQPGYEDESDFAVKLIHVIGELISDDKGTDMKRIDSRSNRMIH